MLKFESPDLKRFAKSFGDAPKWSKTYVKRNMIQLGRRVAYIMRQNVKRHRYTGALEDSIISEYKEGIRPQVEIGPHAKRGRWDAGLILERGTRPIERLPFGPIKKWAEFRGLPAGGVWYNIKTRGVKKHPFLDRTMQDGRTQVALKNTAKRIGKDLALYSVQKFPGGGFASDVSIFGGG